MYFLSYLFKFMPLYFISHFSSWLELACIVMFLIFIVHSYVAPTLNKLNNNNGFRCDKQKQRNDLYEVITGMMQGECPDVG